MESITSSATDQLLRNLEGQLQRLVEQLNDIEEMKTDLSPAEYDRMKLDTVDQLSEFTGTLNRMQKNDFTLDSKFTLLRQSIRHAISGAYNTAEIRQIFSAISKDCSSDEDEVRKKVLEDLFNDMEKVEEENHS